MLWLDPHWELRLEAYQSVSHSMDGGMHTQLVSTSSRSLCGSNWNIDPQFVIPVRQRVGQLCKVETAEEKPGTSEEKTNIGRKCSLGANGDTLKH